MNKCIVTVVGQDTVGIIAKVCTYLAEHKINILDITQTITSGFFNMMMVVDIEDMSIDFSTVCDELQTLGAEIGVDIRCQKAEIFKRMHRL